MRASRLPLALAILLGPTAALTPSADAQIRTGTAAMPFLLIEPSARVAAMGNAGAAAYGGAMSAYYNPGSLGYLEGNSAEFTHSPWLADITYDYGAVAVRLGPNTLLLSITALNSGEMEVRTIEQPLGTGERFSVSDLAIGLGAGRRFTDRFAAGVQAKYLQETIWHSSASAFAVDAGVLYRLPFQRALLGASVSNFGTRSKFDGRDLRIRFDPDPDEHGGNSNLPAALETDSYALPIFFRVGVAFPVELGAGARLDVAVDAYQPSDSGNSVSVGGEWSFRDMLFARGGYQNLFLEESEGGLTFGGGLRYDVSGFDFRFDYAWADHGRLGAAQRFSASASDRASRWRAPSQSSPMRPLRLAVALAALGGSAAAAGQTVVPLFDERDIPGADYYGASAGVATGGDALQLAGPDGTRLPLETSAAHAGAVSGRLVYHHVAAGAFSMRVDAPSGLVDLTEADSLVFYVNGPLPVVGPELPRFGLEDAVGHPTAVLPFPLGTTIGFNAGRSGFRPGSSTDAVFTVAYVEAGGLPPELVRPGYPEDLTFTFADVPLDTSQAAIGLPATPARFRIDAATGLQLDFRFRDLNGNLTLDQPGEFVEVLTVAPGTTTQRVTWRIALDAPALDPPGAGDVYLLAVDNAGLDADPATWQRVGVRMIEFGPLGAFDLTQVRGVRLAHGGVTAGTRVVWFDAAHAVDRGTNPTGPPPPTALVAQAGDATVVLLYTPGAGALGTHVYRAAAPQGPFERLTRLPMRTPDFADLTATNGQSYTYILRSVGAFGTTGPDSAPAGATPVAGGGDPFLDLNAERAFFYFWEQANAANGLVRDRSRAESASSIAAVGFGLTAIPVGIENGWVTREAGRQRVLNTLRHLWTCPQGPQAVGVCGYRGFFYHFLTMDAGLRDGGTELSTIDSALLFGGVIFAREYFDGTDAGDVEVRALADSITRRVDWAWAAPRPPRVALGWFPDSGFIDADWTGYNEAMLIYILGLGSPTHPLPDGAWDAWTSGYAWATHYGHSFVEFPPLFGHQYTHAWVDFRGIADAYMRDHGIDYFENSRRATLAQRAYSADNPSSHPNYSIDEWGITASDDPFGYSARGAPPAQNDNGTIAPTAPGGSIAFTPAESRGALRQVYLAYGSQLWGSYGFRDAYNVRENWFATDYIGIDQGPIVVMIENLRSGLVWDRFMANADVLQGLERAGFEPFVASEPGPPAAAPSLALAGANPAAARTALRLALPADSAVRLRVFDLLGRAVAVLADGPLAAGEHVIAFDVGGWAAGLYIARLDAAGAVASIRLAVVR